MNGRELALNTGRERRERKVSGLWVQELWLVGGFCVSTFYPTRKLSVLVMPLYALVTK